MSEISLKGLIVDIQECIFWSVVVSRGAIGHCPLASGQYPWSSLSSVAGTRGAIGWSQCGTQWLSPWRDQPEDIWNNREYEAAVSAAEIHFYSLLVMRQCQWTYSTAASWECIQRRKVECPPYFNDATITSCHQIFTVSGQKHSLEWDRKIVEFPSDSLHPLGELLPDQLTCKLSLCDSCRNRLPLIVYAATFPLS